MPVRHILAADIGGTNTRFALVATDGCVVTISERRLLATAEISDMEAELQRFIATLPQKPQAIGIGAAGPVRDGRCTMVNRQLIFSAPSLQALTGIPTAIANDFSSLCRSIPALEHLGDAALRRIHGPQEELQHVSKVGVGTIVGAGTGLGVGYFFRDEKSMRIFSSEAGHGPLPALGMGFDELYHYCSKRAEGYPYVEQLVSGPGLAMLAAFFHDSGRIPASSFPPGLLQAPDDHRAQMVSRFAPDNEACRRIMELFVRLFARTASAAALYYTPRAGIYLGGGIAPKNEHWFADFPWFMDAFHRNSSPTVSALLKEFPVWLIKDPDAGLYGSALLGFDLLLNGNKD